MRDWIWVEDHCAAVDLVRREGADGEVYNIGGRSERSNIEVVRTILRELGKPESLIQFVTDRPGHDLRYAIDDTRISSELGFEPLVGFDEGIRRTVSWYRDNETWWRRVKSEAYRGYYDRMYGGRLGTT